jgi:hypothetical protein
LQKGGFSPATALPPYLRYTLSDAAVLVVVELLQVQRALGPRPLDPRPRLQLRLRLVGRRLLVRRGWLVRRGVLVQLTRRAGDHCCSLPEPGGEVLEDALARQHAEPELGDELQQLLLAELEQLPPPPPGPGRTAMVATLFAVTGAAPPRPGAQRGGTSPSR